MERVAAKAARALEAFQSAAGPLLRYGNANEAVKSPFTNWSFVWETAFSDIDKFLTNRLLQVVY